MIRPIEEADADDICELVVSAELFPPEEVEIVAGLISEYFSTNREAGHRCVVVSAEGTKPSGVAYYQPAVATDRTWYLMMIGVTRDSQRTGQGSKLLRYVEDSLREVGQRLLLIETSATEAFEKARNFYVKNGYEEEARVRDFYASSDDMVLFRKLL